MVDVSGKEPTVREATAAGFVRMSPETVAVVRAGGLSKGDALGVAKIAGIMAAKKTPELIPLCHPLALSKIDVSLQLVEKGVRVEATVRTRDRTGVEMEALVAVSVDFVVEWQLRPLGRTETAPTDSRRMHVQDLSAYPS